VAVIAKPLDDMGEISLSWDITPHTVVIP